jgi:hypothetical protein
MSEFICHYRGDRTQAIVSYLYGDDAEFDRSERSAFEGHLRNCERCREELVAFGDVRTTLGGWSPPVFESILRPADSPERHHAPERAWWRAVPWWAQAAAAVLCLAAGAGLANLDVRYDANGLRLRTGWLPAASVATETGASGAPWRGDLTALESSLRAELKSASAANVATAVNTAAADSNADVLRRARSLIEDSERRQQRELALRLAEAMREVTAQRQADLIRIDRNIGAMQNNTGLEILRQRNEMLLRTSSQRAR